jgi:hypothetical protein
MLLLSLSGGFFYDQLFGCLLVARGFGVRSGAVADCAVGLMFRPMMVDRLRGVRIQGNRSDVS